MIPTNLQPISNQFTTWSQQVLLFQSIYNMIQTNLQPNSNQFITGCKYVVNLLANKCI